MSETIKFTLALAVAVAAVASLKCDHAKSKLAPPTKPKASISPPPTAAELAQFRIITNQFGTMAIQQLIGTNWEQRPNRWSTVEQCRWDMEWWIANSGIRPNTQEEQSVWSPR